MHGLESFAASVINGPVLCSLHEACPGHSKVFFSNYIVGLPLAALFLFKLSWGVMGLCFGLLLGTTVNATLVWCMDRELQADKAAARVGVSQGWGDNGGLHGDQGKHEDDLEEAKLWFLGASSASIWMQPAKMH